MWLAKSVCLIMIKMVLCTVPAYTCVLFQLRREARQRREYLYRKAQEEKLQVIQDKKEKIKKALDGIEYQLAKLVCMCAISLQTEDPTAFVNPLLGCSK